MAKIATYAPNVFSHQMRTLLESGILMAVLSISFVTYPAAPIFDMSPTNKTNRKKERKLGIEPKAGLLKLGGTVFG
jgi:hypothetical protein